MQIVFATRQDDFHVEREPALAEKHFSAVGPQHRRKQLIPPLCLKRILFSRIIAVSILLAAAFSPKNQSQPSHQNDERRLHSLRLALCVSYGKQKMLNFRRSKNDKSSMLFLERNDSLR